MLTKHQIKILKTISQGTDNVRDLVIKFNTFSIYKTIRKLEKLGLVKIKKNKKIHLSVTRRGKKFLKLIKQMEVILGGDI